jgi:UDP-N-acetylmuramoyl-L-alanyl-D-glutamate--2,6-diaminopimelate ligase
MAELSLAELVQRGHGRRVTGDDSVRVRGIKHDSRRAEPGDLFAAVPGLSRHGAEFARDAIARGAVAVLCDHAVELEVPVLIADDVLIALSAIASALYDHPCSQMVCVGVTGTNGKTTTAYLIEAALREAGHRPAVFGTVNFRGPGGERPATHTTPMADDLMRLARWAVDTGATHLVLEVSSHALAMHRADAVPFAVAALTNLTHDHLDYHGDFASYAAAKRRLFEDLRPAVSVLNVDDAFGVELAGIAKGRTLRCSRKPESAAEIRVLQASMGAGGIEARVVTPAGELMLQSPLVGEHNLENLLIALGCAIGLGLDVTATLRALASCSGAPGRLERVADSELAVFVDYAHTPDALARVLRAVRAASKQRLFLVFGCGGDRDRAKRPEMGRAAVELADVVIATSDNPRTEPPARILDEIEVGIRAAGGLRLEPAELARAARGYCVEVDRRAAIELAIRAARPGDSVLIAGKGHEDYQILGTRREPFDDRAEARAALARRRGAS